MKAGRLQDEADRVERCKLMRPNLHGCLIGLCQQGDGGGGVLCKLRGSGCFHHRPVPVLQEAVSGHAMLVAQVREADGYAPSAHTHQQHVTGNHTSMQPCPYGQVIVHTVLENKLGGIDQVHTIVETTCIVW